MMIAPAGYQSNCETETAEAAIALVISTNLARLNSIEEAACDKVNLNYIAITITYNRERTDGKLTATAEETFLD